VSSSMPDPLGVISLSDKSESLPPFRFLLFFRKVGKGLTTKIDQDATFVKNSCEPQLFQSKVIFLYHSTALHLQTFVHFMYACYSLTALFAFLYFTLPSAHH